MKNRTILFLILSALTFFAASADAQTTVSTRWLGAKPDSCTPDKNNSQLIYVYGETERGQYECVPPGVYRRTNFQPNASGSQTGLLTGSDYTSFSSKVSPSRTISTGSGLSGGGDLSANRTLAVDISGLTAKTSVAANDSVMIYDQSAGQLKKMSRSDFVAGLTGNAGTVTSVALSVPSVFSVSGSPVTTAGTLSVSLAAQAQNQVFAAPDGIGGVPVFRALGSADIPNLAASKITSGTFQTARIVTGTVTNGRCLRIDSSGNVAAAAADCSAGAASPLTLTANSASEIPLTLKSAASQVGNLFENRNDSNSLLSYFDPEGRLTVPSGAYMVRGGLNFANGSGVTSQGNGGIYLHDSAFSTSMVFSPVGQFLSIGGAHQFTWSSSSSNPVTAGSDTGLARFQAGAVRATNGGSGNGALLADQLVVQKTSSYGVALNESGTLFTNQGATASLPFTLPAAAQNLHYVFCVQDADGMTVTAAVGNTIRIGANVSAAGGAISSTSVGSCIALTAINSTEWFAAPGYVGTWNF